MLPRAEARRLSPCEIICSACGVRETMMAEDDTVIADLNRLPVRCGKCGNPAVVQRLTTTVGVRAT